ncbi:MAG: hypothetical protein ACERKZ_06995 [Lachnotalea sp.]
MKIKDLQSAHCPYCSNHCPLTKPKCHKGKELATKLAVSKKLKSANDPTSSKITVSTIDEKLLTLLCSCSNDICPKASFQLRRLLLLNGSMSEKALSSALFMKSSESEKIIRKLIKKGIVHRLPTNKDNEYLIVLSQNGIKKTKKAYSKYTNQISNHFQSLDELQKQQLELLLEHLIQ